ncbi:MAG: MFS transporter [Candidatus Abyssobacteria bacterium SURF_5]|uniref:MFS transporter n=1 Tax=Abyssobacteria bacterium (strain SURF_5) TaxID=2093360 RepID=A0A3A4N075_ABYX5|nr:MAG: MFS transporter [Candidatus Abyssubacteria bacterium SURF_5]
MQMGMAVKQKVFYGWWIVLVSSFVIFFGTGIGFYSFGVFVKPLEASFGWSRAAISATIAVWALVYGVTGPVIGALLHKYGARYIIAASALIAGICWLFLSRLTGMSQLFVLMFFSGIGTAGITLIPNQTLISNWFDRYRGRAMGIMMVGIGLGGLTMPPLANFLITTYSWRVSFFVLGLILLGIIPPVLLFIRTRPADMGLEPDGVIHAHDGGSDLQEREARSVVGLSTNQAVRTSSFWLLFGAFACLIFGESGLTVHFVALIDDAGVSSQMAATYWAIAVGISSAGRLGFGFLSDRFNPKNLIATTHGLHAVALVLLLVFFLYLKIQSPAVLLPFSILYGLSLGGSAVLLPVVVARCFGMLSFSKLLGLLMSGFALGVVGGPVVAGSIADATGSYTLAIILFIAAFLTAAAAVSFVRLDLAKKQVNLIPSGSPGIET